MLSPFRQSYRYLQRSAHESPVIYYSLVIGIVGPVLAIVVPSIRESYGYRRSDMIPTTYPLPNRPRRPIQGYEDE